MFFKLMLSALVLTTLLSPSAKAQSTDTLMVEVSGVILTVENNRILPVPFANIALPKNGRGTYSNYSGVYSIVAKKGDVIEFSCIGFDPETVTIPKDLKGARYTLTVNLKANPIELPQALVFPWPDRDHLRLDFLAMKPGEILELQAKARENLSEETLNRAKLGMQVDGVEASSVYMRRQAQNLYYYGQAQPIQVLNPFAWQQFFNQLKKNKEKKDKEKLKED